MNPSPRPLATVTRIPTAAEQAMVMIPVAVHVAQCTALAAAATLVREIRTRAAAQNHRVPHREYKNLAARLDALAPLLEEN